MVVPRVPTAGEFAQMQGLFPGLTQANVLITAEPTSVYNCIAFSLLITNAWINPPQPLAPFQAYYNTRGHATLATGSGAAQIDGWATPVSGPSIATMTHGSRVTTNGSMPGRWESKLGQWFRITHGRAELTGNTYGRVVTSFA